MKDMNNKISLLKELFPFSAGLTEREREEFANNSQISSFKKGDTIHGGSSDCIGVVGVESGRLRAFLFSDEGKEITLFRLLSGDACMLSASCMLKNIAFDIHVEAEEESRLLIINPPYFDRMAQIKPEIEKFKNDIISMRFSEVMWLMEQVLFMRMDKRVANLLLEKVSLAGDQTLELTHQDMADDLGTAREVVSRILKYFENDGIIKIGRKQIIVLDWGRLTAAAE